MTANLVFILVYQQTNPWQTMPGVPCGLSQPPANCWLHHVLPVVPQALADAGRRPEREAPRVAGGPLAGDGTPDLAMDGTERRHQRPTDPTRHKEHDSGKQKAHTDNNLLLVNATTRKVVSRGPAVPRPGRTASGS